MGREAEIGLPRGLAHGSCPGGAAGPRWGVRAGGPGRPHTPGRAFIYGALSGAVLGGDKVYERGGVSGGGRPGAPFPH